jgi:hypothetical protein
LLPDRKETSELSNLTSGGPSGNKSLADLKTWCKNNGTMICMGNIYYTESSDEGWAAYTIYNKTIDNAYAIILLYTKRNMYYMFSSNLSQTTPTWSVYKVALTAA